MYLEHFQLHSSPFSEEANPENFFPGAGRADICKKLIDDIRQGRRFAYLLGSEGSGKTLLCKRLLRRLGGSVKVIYVENPMGSFDDLLRLVCVDLGSSPELDPDELLEEFSRQLRERSERGQRVVLIIDDAEKIFLAALERLLRLLCEIEEIGNFTVILVGRPALAANLEQLGVYCSGVELTHGYELEPLDLDQTGQYLLHRLVAAGLKEPQLEEIFAGQAVEKIFRAARGNPRMTNILAEEALRKSSDEKSFMVLLEHVGGTGEDAAEGQGQVVRRGSGRGWKKGAIVCFVVLVILAGIGLFVFRGDDRGGISPPPLPVQHDQPRAASSTSQETKAPAQQREPGSSGSASKAPRVSHGDEVKKSVPSVQTAQKTVVPQQSTEQEKQSGKALFEQRMRASAAWLSGAYSGKYTIQLMMLTSRSARYNVEKLLTRQDYASVLNDLYILQKKTTPPTLFLFYGTYPSMDAARQARNTMPIFLRKHHPYALSIADALTKTED